MGRIWPDLDLKNGIQILSAETDSDPDPQGPKFGDPDPLKQSIVISTRGGLYVFDM